MAVALVLLLGLAVVLLSQSIAPRPARKRRVPPAARKTGPKAGSRR